MVLWFLLVWLNQSANMKMQPSPGHSTWSRSSEGLLFSTKWRELPVLVCGVFYNLVLSLPHLLSMAPQNATPASVLVCPVSRKHTFSVSHLQPLFASDPFSFFLQEPAQFSSVQSLSLIRLFVIPWIAARQASLSITNSWSSLKLMSDKHYHTINQMISHEVICLDYL